MTHTVDKLSKFTTKSSIIFQGIENVEHDRQSSHQPKAGVSVRDKTLKKSKVVEADKENRPVGAPLKQHPHRPPRAKAKLSVLKERHGNEIDESLSS